MSRKWSRKNGKRLTLKTIDGDSARERLAFWAGVKAAAAAAAAALDHIYHESDPQIREFIDDMELLIDYPAQDPGRDDRILDSYGIWLSRDHADPVNMRFTFKLDTDLCRICSACSKSNGLYHCRITDTTFRRGRARCKRWRGVKVAEWQQKIMSAGGPPLRNDISENREEWMEMMDEIRTGENL